MKKTTTKEAEAVLTKQDPVLGALIKQQQLEPRGKGGGDYFAALCKAIVGQQVSVAAARAIYTRLQDNTAMEPGKVVQLSDEQVKVIGLSRQKISYIKDLARHFVEDPEVYNHLDRQDDEQVIAELVAVKGIGEWTAQMFLMFTLERPDVFAWGDGGLQRAMVQLYGWPEVPGKKKLIAVAENWKPYRSVACLHLWHSLDNKPV